MSLESLKVIASLLQETTAVPVIAAAGGSPSPLYDLEYRLVINACSFTLHAKPGLLSPGISRQRLKFIQFVAMRPWLTATIERWSKEGRDQSLPFDHSQRVRRAFLGDTVHDAVVDYLIACSILAPIRYHLELGLKGELFKTWHSYLVEKGLFIAERQALKDLARMKITNAMLEA